MSQPPARWAPLVACAVVCAGVGAGIWKQSGAKVAEFCFLFILAKTIACWGAWARWGRRPLVERGAGRFWAVAVFAAVINGVAWIAYFDALERGPLGLVQLLTSLYAAVGAVLAIVFLGERLGFAQAVGVALVLVAGAVLAALGEGPLAALHGGRWVVPGLAAVVLWGANTVLLKYGYSLPGADDTRMFLAHWSGLFATLVPYGLWRVHVETQGTGTWLPALVVAVVYVLSDLTLYAATARGPASIIYPIYGLYPALSIAYGIELLGERPDWREGLAIALGLAGTLLVTPRDNGALQLVPPGAKE